MKISKVQEIIENGKKTKVMIINEAENFGDVVHEVTKFLDEKTKAPFNKKVTVAISFSFPIPKSDKILEV